MKNLHAVTPRIPDSAIAAIVGLIRNHHSYEYKWDMPENSTIRSRHGLYLRTANNPFSRWDLLTDIDYWGMMGRLATPAELVLAHSLVIYR